MKKLVILLMLLMPLVMFAQKYPTNGMQLHIIELVNKTVTIAADDSSTAITGIVSEDCDSIAFIISVRGDSTLNGTTRDSLEVYLKSQNISPDDDVNVTAWASLDLVKSKLFTAAGNLIHVQGVGTSADTPYKKYTFRVINYAEGSQRVTYKVWAVKRWVR